MRPWNLETSLTITKPPKLSLWYEATHLIHIDFSCFITFTSWGVIAACYTLIRLNWTLFVVRLTMRAIISTIALVRQKSNLISQFTGLWLLMKAITTQELKLFLLDSYFFNYNHNHIISCESKIVHTTTLDTCTLYTHSHCTSISTYLLIT